MRSLSEIETTSKRASRAAGYSWGISEDVGKNIRLLELFGLPGIKYLDQYLKKKRKKKFEILKLINRNNKKINLAFCPINIGVSFLDQIKTIEPLKKIKFDEIAYPILFIPFLSRSSEIIGKKILLKFGKNEFLFNFNQNILTNYFKKQFPIKAQNVEIKFLENKNNFTSSEWKSLYKLSEETFVDETDSLKHGAAGAGLTDND